MNANAVDISNEIKKIREKLKVVILAHNYQIDEIQSLADITGDSLELARAALKTEAEIILFCGVHFMAETAAILNPDKTVLMPNPNAGCPMADMITAEQLIELKQKHPKAAVVCYVNSSAAVKAESDICCTSSNAVQVVNSLSEEEVIFIPDRNLGRYVSGFTNKKIILWDGFCPTHVRLPVKDVLEIKNAHPEASFFAHPECEPEVLAIADYVCSTAKMLKYAREVATREIIIGTEMGMLYRLRNENPGKVFIPASRSMICPNMKKNNLELVYESLVNFQTEITVPEKTGKRALNSIRRMLEIS